MPPRSPSWTEAINPCQSTSASLFQQDDNACLTLIQRAWGGWRAPPPAEERIILLTDLRAGASPTLTTPGFHRTAGICTRRRFLVKKQQHQLSGEVRDERHNHKERGRERWELYSRAFWEAAVLSGLSGCQDEAKVHRWSATETADAEHLVFPDLSLLISLSLPAFTHARSTWLSASSADLISLSLSLSLGLLW